MNLMYGVKNKNKEEKTMKKIATILLAIILLSVTVWGWYNPNQVPTKYLCESDINEDGIINIFDLGLVKSHLFEKVKDNPEAEIADVNGNGIVNLGDMRIVIGNLFKSLEDC